jgi:hypothetical protein
MYFDAPLNARIHALKDQDALELERAIQAHASHVSEVFPQSALDLVVDLGVDDERGGNANVSLQSKCYLIRRKQPGHRSP